MTKAGCEAIRKRANAATQGPWGAHEMPALSGGYHKWYEIGPYPGDAVAEITNDYENFRANAEFLGAARTDVPTLCNAVDGLMVALNELADEKSGSLTRAKNLIREWGGP